jgi:V/A-type H+-transporting ATPase subunit A
MTADIGGRVIAGDGRVIAAVGPVVRATGLERATVGEVVHVGDRRLLGEIIGLEGDVATIQVYEETGGLVVGAPVVPTGAPLRARLGPGLLGTTFDGLQRPLERLARAGRWLLQPGLAGEAGARAPAGGEADAAQAEERWTFEPERRAGDRVSPGDVLGSVAEGPLRHRILAPPDAAGGVLTRLDAGQYTADEPIGRVDPDPADGTPYDVRLVHEWPVRRPRPVRRRRASDRPLVTGQRVFDMLFPIAQGGTAVIPGGFGTGKTVVEQSLARWSDADIVVYVGCGERGNEMAELLARFPELVDPRTGAPLLARTVLIANTSNMPVAAREASVQLGITIAEYFRDQGLDVALLADSTSRWAEALREISGRLEELPGEEGFPAYLGSRLAAFYERAGRADTIGEPERHGSITLVGAVSPPGGDFSEPVTQASLRLAGTFWALDADLAHARHFPAVGWTTSYSLYIDRLTAWYRKHVDPEWPDRRAAAIALLAREKQLLDIVQLVGADALPDEDRVDLETARILRETFLQQHAFDPVDAARPLDVQFALLRAVLAAGEGMRRAIEGGATLEAAIDSPALAELRLARQWSGDDVAARLAALAARLEAPSAEPSAAEPSAAEVPA